MDHYIVSNAYSGDILIYLLDMFKMSIFKRKPKETSDTEDSKETAQIQNGDCAKNATTSDPDPDRDKNEQNLESNAVTGRTPMANGKKASFIKLSITAAALAVSNRTEEGFNDRPPDVDQIMSPLYKIMHYTGMLPVFFTPLQGKDPPEYTFRRYLPICVLSVFILHVSASTITLCIINDSILRASENLNFILFLLSTLYTVYVFFSEMTLIRRFLRGMTEFLSDLPDEQIQKLRLQMLRLLGFISIFNVLSLGDDLYHYHKAGATYYFMSNVYGIQLSETQTVVQTLGRILMTCEICVYEFLAYVALLTKVYYITLARFLLYKIREFNDRFSVLDKTKLDSQKVLMFLHTKFDRVMIFVNQFDRIFSRLLIIWLAEIICNLYFTFQNAFAARKANDLVACILNVLEFLFYTYMVGLTIFTASEINEDVSAKLHTLNRQSADLRYIENSSLRYLMSLLRDKLRNPTARITLRKFFPLTRPLIIWAGAGLSALLAVQYEVSTIQESRSVDVTTVSTQAG